MEMMAARSALVASPAGTVSKEKPRHRPGLLHLISLILSCDECCGRSAFSAAQNSATIRPSKNPPRRWAVRWRNMSLTLNPPICVQLHERMMRQPSALNRRYGGASSVVTATRGMRGRRPGYDVAHDRWTGRLRHLAAGRKRPGATSRAARMCGSPASMCWHLTT